MTFQEGVQVLSSPLQPQTLASQPPLVQPAGHPYPVHQKPQAGLLSQDGVTPLIEPDLGYFQMPDGRRVIEDPDNPGKWTAVIKELDPVVSAAAAAAIAAAQQGQERMEGVVADWTGNPGYGFVHFADGRRAYVHSSQCGGQALVKGQAVAAEIVEDPKNPGKWQAVGVERLQALTTASTGRMEGVVAEWTGSPGYGFIHFADGRRAYVHNSQCGGCALAKGQPVTGLILEDPKNPGKWQAQSVAMAGLSSVQPPAGNAPGTPAALPLPAPTPAGALQSPGNAVAPMQERRQGVVAQWSEKGFGFIQFTDGPFAYVHNSSCGGQRLVPGEAVTAIIVEDSKNPGKLAAQEVQRLHHGEEGVLVEWDNNRGCGVLHMDDQRRISVSRSGLGSSENLAQGLRLRVRTAQDPHNPGGWCVTELLGPPAQESLVMGERLTGTVVRWDNSGDGKGSVGILLMEDGRQAEVHDSRPLESGQVISAVLAPDSQRLGKFVAQGLEMGAYTGDEGTVTEWHENQGYGFIQLDDGRKLYIHRSAFGGVGGLEVPSRIRVTTKPDIRNPGKWMAGQVVSADGGVGGKPTRPVAQTATAGPPALAMALQLPAGGVDRGGIGGSGIVPSSRAAAPTLGTLLNGGSSPAVTELVGVANAAKALELAEPLAKRARSSAVTAAAQFPML